VKATARVDVIAGTSAGGLNGGFLALARCYRADLGPLRNLWATKGALGALFRSPFEKDPASLLRGDEFFLPELRLAFAEIFPGAGTSGYVPPADAPIDLTMTTTVMTGIPRLFRDDFGTAIQEVDHKGRFHFVRGARTRAKDDPFATDAVVARLALASRSTASFPFAFEPSFCPVNETVAKPDHPDMAGYCNFRNSRYVLDGGVLLNKPVRPALDAIFRLPADRQVRRVLAYVNPDPGALEKLDVDDDVNDPPKLSKVMIDSLSSLPRAQSISAELEEIQEHNSRVRERARLRVDLVESLGPALSDLAPGLFEAYKRVRIGANVEAVAERVGSAAALSLDGLAPGTPPQWTHEELAAALEAQSMPFVPPSARSLESVADVWEWGLAPIERIAATALDVFKRAMLLAPLDDGELREALRGHRAALHEHVLALRPLLEDHWRFWSATAATLPEPPAETADRPETLGRWARASLELWPVGAGSAVQPAEYRRGLTFLVTGLVAVLVGAGRSLRAAVAAGAASASGATREEATRLRLLLDAVYPSDPEDEDRVLRRLLRLEVAFVALGGESRANDQEVALVQVSGNTPNSFGGPSRGTDKLAGIQVGHFGAFYKQAWRANDWTWGRIDGATRLCQVVLAPARLQQLQLKTSEALKLVRKVAVDDATETDRPTLENAFDPVACEDELTFLDDDTRPMPPSLPACAMAIARRVHLEIVREELPYIAAGVEADLADKAATDGASAQFLRAYGPYREQDPQKLAPDVAFPLFAQSGIGAEKIADEAGTDLFASTVSTAAAVSVSAADSPRSGLGFLRMLTRSLRGVMLVLYALVRGAVSSGRAANAAVAFTLAAGGALLALALVTPDSSPFFAALGGAIALGAVMLAALRTREMKRFAFVLGVLVLLLVIGLVVLGIMGKLPSAQNAVTAGVVFVVMLFFFGLGSIREKPRRSRRR
jgi:patatin-related protein